MIKQYTVQRNIGKARHVVNSQDGVKTHDDGSPFWDIHVFKNIPSRDKFIARLIADGYTKGE